MGHTKREHKRGLLKSTTEKPTRNQILKSRATQRRNQVTDNTMTMMRWTRQAETQVWKTETRLERTERRQSDLFYKGTVLYIFY